MKSVEKLTETELGEGKSALASSLLYPTPSDSPLLRVIQVWALHYVFPPPVSPRVFVQLLTKHLETNSESTNEASEPPARALRTGYVIQLAFNFPSDAPADAEIIRKIGKGVRGTYVSVERYQELEDGSLEWRMATSSTPGGSIPGWVSERSIPGEIMKVSHPPMDESYHMCTNDLRGKDVPALIGWIKKQGSTP